MLLRPKILFEVIYNNVLKPKSKEFDSGKTLPPEGSTYTNGSQEHNDSHLQDSHYSTLNDSDTRTASSN